MVDNTSQARIRSEQVTLIYKASIPASISSLIAACFLSYIQWPVISHGIILTWLVCMVILSIIRPLSVVAFFRKKPGLSEIKSWERLSIFITIIAAVIWGAAGVFLFPEGVFERQTGTIVILAGMSAGASATFSALRLFNIVFVPSLMLPLTVHLFTESTSMTFSLAIMCLVYTVFLLQTAERNYKTNLQNISLKIQSHNEGEMIRKSKEADVKTAEILKLIASGESASKIYDAIALLYESRHPGLRCSMLTLQGDKLLHGGAPSLPESYCQAVHGLENGPNIGSCGTSTYTGQRVIVEDIETDPKWSSLKSMALQHGLRSCWSEPIKNSSGKVMGAFGMYHDHPAVPTDEELSELKSAASLAAIVMEREERESQLRQKNKMEAVGYMAGGMAHNFNNNLSIILGNIELSQLKLQGDPQLTPLLKNAKTAVLRSRDLIKKIITYSRKGSSEKTLFQPFVIINETVELLRSTLPTTINLETVTSPDCAATFIHADASQIQEALINLCNNAIQAMDEKGDLKINLVPVELDKSAIPAQYDAEPGRYAKLSIQDNGCGMPAEMLDKIFDPFYSTKEDYEGAGMGLATVQGTVAQHGGIIKVNSVPEQGTVFNLYFPIVDPSPDTVTPEPDNATMPEGTEQILFVDDDESLANLGGELLTEMGYQVSTMTDSTEALKLFAANADRFDLVITDQTMPDLTGKELTQKIKKIRPDIPTILCTGFSSKIDEAKATELGINAFLMKPLDLPELSQTVRRVLDEKEK